jgi:putative two-component system response regulator
MGFEMAQPERTSPPTILVVDDEPAVRNLLAQWLTSRGYRCKKAEDAAAAWEHLQSGPIELVTTDIAMPNGSGIELLQRIRAHFPETAVVMLTGLKDSRSAIETLTAGAIGYLTKPVRSNEYLAQVQHGLEWHRLKVESRQYTERLEQQVREQTQAVRRAHEETIHRLVSAVTCRDIETGAHVVRTGLFSEIVARAVGWSTAEAERIRLAAPMHDIGKIGVPDSILRKPSLLTADEYELMKRHTVIGGSMLAGSNEPVLRMAHEIALNHHERWDGTGYPAGIAGEAIPEAARIVSIVDVYDALSSKRVYRPAMSEKKVIDMIAAGQGSQFDPYLLAGFFSAL